jgi:hypothetical protein
MAALGVERPTETRQAELRKSPLLCMRCAKKASTIASVKKKAKEGDPQLQSTPQFLGNKSEEVHMFHCSR